MVTSVELAPEELAARVRPWDLPALQRGVEALGEVASARAAHVDDDWRLVRFADGDDGAPPCTTYVRGVIVDGNRGLLLTGSGDSALIIEG